MRSKAQLVSINNSSISVYEAMLAAAKQAGVDIRVDPVAKCLLTSSKCSIRIRSSHLDAVIATLIEVTPYRRVLEPLRSSQGYRVTLKRVSLVGNMSPSQAVQNLAAQVGMGYAYSIDAFGDSIKQITIKDQPLDAAIRSLESHGSAHTVEIACPGCVVVGRSDPPLTAATANVRIAYRITDTDRVDAVGAILSAAGIDHAVCFDRGEFVHLGPGVDSVNHILDRLLRGSSCKYLIKHGIWTFYKSEEPTE